MHQNVPFSGIKFQNFPPQTLPPVGRRTPSPHTLPFPTSITALTSSPSFKRQPKTFLFTKSFPSV